MLKQIKESILDNHLIYYPTPLNLNFFWSSGSLAGICLLIQLISGIFLAMYYIPSVEYAFVSIEHIVRDVKYGWFMRYLHANSASFFFIFVYLHISRNIFYGSYFDIRLELWSTGVIILFLMMATAFLGYVLPWGQMSFWGATVITNLLSVIPFMGTELVEWLWGGFSVNTATLTKFYSFHFILPFCIVGVVFIHLNFLHSVGSNNPLGIKPYTKMINFYPYFYIKDILSLIIMLFFMTFIISFYPNIFGHPDNYIIANPMITPSHIVPEWYFLPFYAILRSVPDKLGGVIAMLGAILMLFSLPLFEISQVRSTLFRPVFLYCLYWSFICICVLLGWLGQKPVEAPFIALGQFTTLCYFSFFFLTINLVCIEGYFSDFSRGFRE